MVTIADTLSSLRSYPQMVGELLERCRYETIQIDLDPRLSKGGKTEAVNAIAAKYMSQIDQMEQAAQADKAALEAAIAQALSQPQGDPTAELARQIKYQRIWERLKGLLDTYEDSQALHRGLSDVIQQAAEAHDLDTLNVLLEEAPAYLASRRMPSMWDAVSPSVQAALVAHASPKERKALQAKQELETGWARLAAAFSEAKRAIQQRATIGVLPGWNENERITLDLPTTTSKPVTTAKDW